MNQIKATILEKVQKAEIQREFEIRCLRVRICPKCGSDEVKVILVEKNFASLQCQYSECRAYFQRYNLEENFK
jgi:hypothetical protein